MKSNRRVVITGMGIISPVGNTVEDAWDAVINGRSGVKRIAHFDASNHRSQIAATVQNFDAAAYMPAKEVRRFDTFVQYGYAAAIQAMTQAGFNEETLPQFDVTRFGSIMGSGIGGLDTIAQSEDALTSQGARRVSPFFIPGSIINMTSGLLAIRFGLKGPNLATATACTTSTHAIGLAARLIAYGDADVMIAGGSEYTSTALGMAGFSSMQALSTRNDDPQGASRPFDIGRDGFVLGDGAGAVIVESLEHALARGATILAEVTGFGMSDDAQHITAPPDDGAGAALAMRNALRDSGLSVEDIGYINAHGTSTPLGDKAESKAIESVFGEHAPNVLVSSTKSMTGHLLGAAGVVEAIFCVKAMQTGVVPPTINLHRQDPECRLNYVPNLAQQAKLKHVMSNSFGFGGTNGTLVLSQFNPK